MCAANIHSRNPFVKGGSVFFDLFVYNSKNFMFLGQKFLMEKMINLQIEKLPEGVYLATSDNIQGLVVQGNSITETIEIARDVAKKLIEAQKQQIAQLAMFNNSFNYPLVVSV